LRLRVDGEGESEGEGESGVKRRRMMNYNGSDVN